MRYRVCLFVCFVLFCCIVCVVLLLLSCSVLRVVFVFFCV